MMGWNLLFIHDMPIWPIETSSSGPIQILVQLPKHYFGAAIGRLDPLA